MNYIPDTLLLNHAYIPFFVSPIKKVFDCYKDFNALEVGSNGLLSVIPLSSNINDQVEQIIPFIDMKKYDSETKDWFWYDSDNFPLRIYKLNDDWVLKPIYEFANNYNHKYTFDPKKLINDWNQSGFYSTIIKDNDTSSQGINVYTGQPIILTIKENIVTDKTIYGESNTTPILTEFNTNSNQEFYYDFNSNKIITNQNLAGIDSSQIKIYFDIIPNSISVKCRMKSNLGENNFSTPTVDYYIIKLNGQYLRG